MSRTAQNMQKLINRKYYDTEEEALEKLDLLMLANRITDDEYTDLVMLAGEVYAPPAPEVTEPPAEPPVDPPVDPDPSQEETPTEPQAPAE